MDKISPILPNNDRIRSVDTQESQPVRPGVPAFGNPVADSPIRDRVSLSSGPAAMGAQKEMATWKTKEQKNADIAARIGRSFFGKKTTEVEPEEMANQQQATENRQIANHASQIATREVRPGSAWSVTEQVKPAPTPAPEKVEDADEGDVDREEEPLRYNGGGMPQAESGIERGSNLSLRA